MIRRSVLRAPLLFAAFALSIVTAPSAFAGSPASQSLTPVPPDFMTCAPAGSGTTCRGTTVDTEGGPWVVLCGSEADPVQLYETATETNRWTWTYDAAGRLVRAVEKFDVAGTILDPATSLTANESQVANVTETFSIPGDMSTGLASIRGVVRYSRPGSGTVFIDVGRELFTDDGVTVWEAGQHPIERFVNGDTSVMAALCTALGSPGTPSLA
jgi:hypothetical protein